MVDNYPLCWPGAYPRSASKKASRFKTTMGAARDFVKEEVRRLGGENLVISTNIPTKQNGDLYANWTAYKIDDHGVAVYFTRKGNQVCLCCDTYYKVVDNMHAIGRTIQALRQIDRDGVSDFLNRAFTGFKMLPEHATGISFWDVLEMEPVKTEEEIHEQYKKLAKLYHPDNGGSAVKFGEISEARKQAIEYVRSK